MSIWLIIHGPVIQTVLYTPQSGSHHFGIIFPFFNIAGAELIPWEGLWEGCDNMPSNCSRKLVRISTSTHRGGLPFPHAHTTLAVSTLSVSDYLIAGDSRCIFTSHCASSSPLSLGSLPATPDLGHESVALCDEKLQFQV